MTIDMNENMAIHKRLNISLHPIEIEKLDQLAKQNNETRSGMIARLIQERKKN
jgi:anaerobic glycerol-3-phosphate dehydrogenase